MQRLQSIPKRKCEFEKAFTNKVDKQLNQVKSALQQVDHDEIDAFKREHNEEEKDDDELVNSNSPEGMALSQVYFCFSLLRAKWGTSPSSQKKSSPFALKLG